MSYIELSSYDGFEEEYVGNMNKYYNPKYNHAHEDYQFIIPSTEIPEFNIGGRIITAKPGKIYFIKILIIWENIEIINIMKDKFASDAVKER